MRFAFVAAVGGVELEDVAVATFQLFPDCGFVDDTGTEVVGECAEEDRVFAVLGVEGAEFGEVFSEQCVDLRLGVLTVSAVEFARLDLMTVSYIRPVAGLMERFKFFLIIRTIRSKSGSSIKLRLAAKAGVVIERVTTAMRNIRIFFIRRWVLWLRD